MGRKYARMQGLVWLLGVLAALLVAAPGRLSADGPGGGVKGSTTSQQGTMRLPGVAVGLVDARGREVASSPSDNDGLFSLADIPPGHYTVVAHLEGFRDATRAVDVQPGAVREVNLDLAVAASESVSVIAKPADTTLGPASSLAPREVVAAPLAEQLPVNSDSIQAALRLMASVNEQTGGVRIKGGRPDQASLQFGSVVVNDETGGAGALRLPVDAADSVEVLPNPYAVEFGGFTSGLTVVHPRSGTDAWHYQMNGLEPSLIVSRSNPLEPVALGSFSPRAIVGGPVIKDRLFLMQSVQYRYRSVEVFSRPQSQRRDSEGVSLFTRLDGKAGGGHTFDVTFGFFPNKSTQADLDTFTPPAATIDLHQQAITAAFTDSAPISASAVLESTAAVNYFSSLADGQGRAPMVVTPEQTFGNFYNTQDRRATTLQWSEVVSASHASGFGTHLFKAGLTVLHVAYDATSTSRPIEVARSDGTIAETLTFDPVSRQQSSATNLTGFGQDRWQPASRLLVEFGTRLEHDGVLGTTNVAPRAGGTLALKADGSIALKAGVGVFTERTPPAVEAFGSQGTQTEARYAADGLTLIAPPVTYVHELAPDLRTPRSLTWNIEFDQRVTPGLSVRVNYLDRQGSNELIVEPSHDGANGVLLLSSTGRSVYRDAEFAVHYAREHVVEATASYTRSLSMADLNAYSVFFGLKQDPFVRPDEYAPTDVYARNRMLVWTSVSVVPHWLFGAVAEVRNGFPYSAVNQYLDYVGPRNRVYAFPTYAALDLSAERHVTVGPVRAWVGVRVYNALNWFKPLDVQANIGSPAFGYFYNSTPIELRLSLRFGR